MEVYLIRHLKTRGNLEKRYIGRTDESLLKDAKQKQQIRRLQERLPLADLVAASPMRRCVETAQWLYPKADVKVYEGLRECDFGLFENRNYEELKELPAYCAWLDSGGTLPFPQGEGHEDFCRRCVQAFQDAVEDFLYKEQKHAVLVVHGGTIMAVLEQFDEDHRTFYHWQAENGSGYRVSIDETEWRNNRKRFRRIEKL